MKQRKWIRSSRGGTIELSWQGRKPPNACDGSPCCSIDFGTLRFSIQVHRSDFSIRMDGEANQGFALRIDRWTRLFGNQRECQIFLIADTAFLRYGPKSTPSVSERISTPDV